MEERVKKLTSLPVNLDGEGLILGDTDEVSKPGPSL
jgi:hypothetical protein